MTSFRGIQPTVCLFIVALRLKLKESSQDKFFEAETIVCLQLDAFWRVHERGITQFDYIESGKSLELFGGGFQVGEVGNFN